MVIINNDVCVCVSSETQKVRESKDRHMKSVGVQQSLPNREGVCLCAHVYKHECVYVCTSMHRGAFIAPFPVAMTHQ